MNSKVSPKKPNPKGKAATIIPASPLAVVTLLWDQDARPLKPEWLKQLRQQGLSGPLLSLRLEGDETIQVLDGRLDAPRDWAARLDAQFPGHPVLVLRAGLVVPEHLGIRLAELVKPAHELDAVLLPGNYHPLADPLAELAAPWPQAHLDRWCLLAGDRLLRPVGTMRWDAAWITLRGLKRLAVGLDLEAVAIADDLYVVDPAAGDDPHTYPQPPLGDVRLRLSELSRENADRLPAIGPDPRPVTLHIAHDWGGGVARWISDFIAGDDHGHHLVLAATSDPAHHQYGQYLELYAAGPGQGRIRRVRLDPPIDSSVIHHPGYRAQLGRWIERFGIGRVIVSSLIGHSLDCLETGLPTIQVLHDYYPAWPLLDVDPLPWTRTDSPPALAAALENSGKNLLFRQTESEFWARLAEGWRSRVLANQVRLVSPTGHVAERWRALQPEAALEIQVIPHGFTPWPGRPAKIKPRPPTRPLHLVILGRLTPGKGLNLLLESLPDLHGQVRITALGCGLPGHALFGHAGVDVIVDYDRDQLPDLIRALQPDAALFLSTVPETWNYALSEARALGLVPIATSTGSFCERIRSGVDGILFEAKPAALVETLTALTANPKALDELRNNLPRETRVGDMAKAYRRLAAAKPRLLRDRRQAIDTELMLANLAGRLADLGHEAQKLSTRRQQLEQDLDRRTRWAQTMERRFRERSQWADQLEKEADRLKGLFDSERRRLEQEIERLQALLGSEQHRLEEEIGRLQALLQSEQHRLEEEIVRLQALLQSEQHRLEEEIVRLTDSLHTETTRLEAEVAERQSALDRTQAELSAILSSRSWRITRPLRVLNRLLINGRARGLYHPMRWPRLAGVFLHHWRLRGLRQALFLLQAPPLESSAPASIETVEPPRPEDRIQPVNFTPQEKPQVSIIIPVHNQLHFTAACLHSLGAVATAVTYEVIVVDDASEDHTAGFLDHCTGLTVLQNKTNLGFIGACNRGAEAARGPYLVFLNNDTTLTDGWLDALIDPFRQDPQVGIVGARLVYPDGKLQEAGGIIFSDAFGWNYGRGEDPDQPQFNFLSEADYVSGACLAIPRALFSSLGGFDDFFAPAYYEDTDLCFKARAAGLKVIYQPACTVIHHEGATSGTDETSGAKRFQAINRDKFKTRWADALAKQPKPELAEGKQDQARSLRFHRFARRALVIDATTPQPDHDSGSVRLVALLRILRDLGYQTSFMPENLAWQGRYSRDLQQAGIEVLTAPWITDPEQWLREHGDRLDLVLVSRHYVLGPLLKLIRTYCPRARLLFDTVDLHFLREQREAELAGTAAARRAAARTRASELALVEQADATLVVSPAEQTMLKQLAPDRPVHLVSNIHPVHGPGKPYEARRDLVFVGGFQHPPNQDAARWLIDEILPGVIEAIPQLRLHLIGSRMPDELRERRAPGLKVHGFVANLEPFMTGCRISVAPLRYGAGVKGKVNQAMSYGLPVVATSCAAEGMYARHEHDMLIADETASFVAQIVRLYHDPDLWQRLANNGLTNVRTHFSEAAARSALEIAVRQEPDPPSRTRSGTDS